VFPAGAHKVVSNFAVIGLHRGLSSTSFDYNESTKKMLAAKQLKERQTMIDQR